MNNKMAKIHIYLYELVESKNQTKQTGRTETESWMDIENILMVAR